MTEYLVIYEQGATSWGAYSPDVQGVAVVGESREHVETLVKEAIAFHLEGLRADGLDLPTPRNAAGVVAA